MASLPPESSTMNNDESLPSSDASSIVAKKISFVDNFVFELSKPDLRENTLNVLSKIIKSYPELAVLLWNSFGIIAIFLKEITSIYPTLSPPTLTPPQSSRVLNTLALLQCVASNSETKMSFLKENLTLYLYPYLRTTSTLPHFEDLRVSSLGVIAALIKPPKKNIYTSIESSAHSKLLAQNKQALGFLLSSEVLPLCLQNIENGKELSKTVATYIVEKILADEDGLAYVCATPERCYALGRALDIVRETLDTKDPLSRRLVQLLISCYSSLSKAKVIFKQKTTLPPTLNLFKK